MNVQGYLFINITSNGCVLGLGWVKATNVNQPGSVVPARSLEQTLKLQAVSRWLAVTLLPQLSQLWSSVCFISRGESTHNFTHRPTQESESKIAIRLLGT